MIRCWLRFIEWFNVRCNALSMRMTEWTGKDQTLLHPKHLIRKRWWPATWVRPGDRVLDAGCGSGAHSVNAVKLGARVLSIDLNPPSLEMPRILRWMSADLEQPLTELRDREFDAVLLLDVLEHVANRTQLLEELRRVLVPGGLLLLSVPNKDTRHKRRLRRVGLPAVGDPDHKVEYVLPEINRELRDAGFAPQFIDVVVYDTPWAGLMSLIGSVWLWPYAWFTYWRECMAWRHPNETTGWRIMARKVECDS